MEWKMKKAFCFLFCLFFAATTLADLPNPILKCKPSLYELLIKTEKEHYANSDKNLTFGGEVAITFTLDVPDKFSQDFDIVLNTNPGMVPTKTTLEGSNPTFAGETTVLLVTPEKKGDKFIIHCKKESLKYKNFVLSISYTNPFGNDMTGLYRSSYRNSEGKDRWLLTTHFEPIFARKAFPCFDQPDLKANFEITIRVPKSLTNYNVLCNSPSKKGDEMGEYVDFNCKKTLIPLSTYLVAFTISDFKSTPEAKFESEYPNFQKERVIKTHGQTDIINNGEGNLAQTIAKAAITELTNYLGLGYAYEKVDQVGIPDFSAGAMENWGLILFREKSLFFNTKTGSTITKQNNVLTITHELVHQWFGNLVTLETWNYIWLNEAFANFLEYLIADKISEKDLPVKDWECMKQFVVIETQLRAFEADGMTSSKALSSTIPDENLIYAAFNDIAYAKGASVLRMWYLENPAKFQETLKAYIAERQKKNANPGQLFEVFKTKMNMKKEAFDMWTERAGYPVVEVKEVNGSYVLSQSRFLWEKSPGNETKWHVPITYSTDKSTSFETTSPKMWLVDKEEKIEKGSATWIVVNNQQQGYYRVNYDRKNWEALAKVLKNNLTSIHELNRAQIINDVYSLARSLQKTYVEYPTALTLTEYLRNEKSFVAWKTALNAFDFLKTKMYKDSALFGEFKNYVLSLIKPHFKSLNCSTLGHVETLKNVEISRWACSLDLSDCVKEANALYKGLSKENPMPDTQEIILCTAIKNNKDAWAEVLKKYETEKDSGWKVMYISALGCSRDRKQLQEFLDSSLKANSTVRQQDRIYVLSSVYNGNLENVDLAFDFVLKNYEKIAKEYGGINPLGKAVVGLAKKLNSKEDLKKFEELKKKIAEGSQETKVAAESMETACSILKSNIDWATEKKDQFKSYFSSGSFLSYSLTLLSACLAFVLNM